MGMGMVIVEICENNAMAAVELEERLEERFPEVAVMQYECLNLCGLCRMRPYALVNGERVFGKTVEDSFEAIASKIEDELKQFE
nr:DUF1450 domain-containing protein [Texcoconibacillus texcoconensis]